MTVAELIEELKKQPQDLQVQVFAGERGFWEASEVWKDDRDNKVVVIAEDCLA